MTRPPLPAVIVPRAHRVAGNVTVSHPDGFTVVPIIADKQVLRLVVRKISDDAPAVCHAVLTTTNKCTWVCLTLGSNIVPVPFDLEPTSAQSKFPRVIHQTDESRVLSDKCYETVMTILDWNPDYTYKFYDDNDRAKVVKDYSADVYAAYCKLEPGAFRADLFRYVILKLEGGFYMDCKQVWKRPLDYLIHELGPSCPSPLLVQDADGRGIFNAFMAAEPGSAAMTATIAWVTENVRREDYGENQLDITGPLALAKAVQTIADPPAIALKHVLAPGQPWYYENHAICLGKETLAYKNYKGYYAGRSHYLDLYVKRQVFRQIT